MFGCKYKLKTSRNRIQILNKLVSYVVAPTEALPGSYCYKMLINAETHEIYYYSRHKISKKYGAGFLPEDIKRINSYRNR